MIVSKAAVPPVCDWDVFDGINKWDCKLYVSAGSLSAYQAAEVWQEFLVEEVAFSAADIRSLIDTYLKGSSNHIIDITKQIDNLKNAR